MEDAIVELSAVRVMDAVLRLSKLSDGTNIKQECAPACHWDSDGTSGSECGLFGPYDGKALLQQRMPSFTSPRNPYSTPYSRDTDRRDTPPPSSEDKTGCKAPSGIQVDLNQHDSLLAAFYRSPYCRGANRREMSARLGMSELSIGRWFLNARRRQKYHSRPIPWSL